MDSSTTARRETPRGARRPPRPRLRGRLLRAPRHSASGPGSARREPGPPSERPRSRWCPVTPARASSGAAACGEGARPTDALGGSGRGRRSRWPPAPPHTRLEMTRQQRSPSKDGPIRPPSRGDNASSAPPLCVETVSYARPHSQAHHQNLSSCICVR